jgi:hypothetical protein
MADSTSPTGNQPRALYYGSTLLVRILPDVIHPRLWRLHWPDGRIPDLTNLARALDAALALAEHEPGMERRRLRREVEQPDNPPGARRRAGAGRRHP